MAAKPDIWMPLYIGDYLAATTHLSAAESGAYLHLLMHQWRNSVLPSDSEALRRIARIESDAWSIAWPVLQQFFNFATGAPMQLRLEEIRAEWTEKKVKAVQKAKSAAARRWNRAKLDASSIPQAMPQRCPSSSPSSIETNTNTFAQNGVDVRGRSIANAEEPPDLIGYAFSRESAPEPKSGPQASTPRKWGPEAGAAVERIYRAYPRKVGRVDALAAIRKAVKYLATGESVPAMTQPEACEFLHGKVTRFARSPAAEKGEFTPHPATWFNRGSFLDDEAEWQKQGEGRNAAKQGNATRGASVPAAVERQRISHESIRAAAARRYGAAPHAAHGKDAATIPSPDAAGGNPGYVAGRVGGDRAQVWNGDVQGRVIEGDPRFEVYSRPA